MDWKCSKCGRGLKTYDDQTALMGQLEGLVCPGCGIAVCDTCHPTSKGIQCPQCQVEMLPNYPSNLEKHYNPASKAGSCFIATVVLNKPDSPEMETLYLFRDQILKPKMLGRAFIYFYYKFGPFFASLVDKSDKAKSILHPFLLCLVEYCRSRLKAKEFKAES
jgi:DNA-directed RNA polymerase subunit RPC12/RpoP